ncbi:MAG: hypothetical protein WDA16_03225 [Candidatus Thermoplasmatota archaeon]
MESKEEARDSRAAYMRTRKRGSVQVYFKDEEERAQFEALATSQGYKNFSGWIVQTLITASTGTVFPADYVAGLQRDVDKYRAWVRQKDEEITELRRDLRLVEAAREDMRVVLASIAHRVPEALVALKANAPRPIMTPEARGGS